MTPAARVAAAIEVLDSYLSGTPAEQALTQWARGHRFAGSKDRAAIRDHVFDALRRLRSSAALGGAQTGRAIMIGLLRGQDLDPADLFTGEGHAPPPLSAGEQAHQADLTRAERLDCPDWLLAHFDDSLGPQADDTLAALRHRAPVFLRVNLARATCDEAQDLLAEDGIVTRPHSLAKTALEVLENPRKINGSRAFLEGFVELQDAASQAVVEALQITPGMRVLDYCAGGGGKSLALAAMGAEVVAHDINPARMKDIPSRAARAGCQITLAQTRDLPDLGAFDLVFGDAPCSGSGSWRRAPHGKWLLTAARFEALLAMQQQVLTAMAPLVGERGALAYATCSVFRAENSAQAARFLSCEDGFLAVNEHRFALLSNADGFYLAQFKRK